MNGDRARESEREREMRRGVEGEQRNNLDRSSALPCPASPRYQRVMVREMRRILDNHSLSNSRYYMPERRGRLQVHSSSKSRSSAIDRSLLITVVLIG